MLPALYRPALPSGARPVRDRPAQLFLPASVMEVDAININKEDQPATIFLSTSFPVASFNIVTGASGRQAEWLFHFARPISFSMLRGIFIELGEETLASEINSGAGVSSYGAMTVAQLGFMREDWTPASVN